MGRALRQADVERQLALGAEAVAGDDRATAAELGESGHGARAHRTRWRGERRVRQIDDLVVRVELRVVVDLLQELGCVVRLLIFAERVPGQLRLAFDLATHSVRGVQPARDVLEYLGGKLAQRDEADHRFALPAGFFAVFFGGDFFAGFFAVGFFAALFAFAFASGAGAFFATGAFFEPALLGPSTLEAISSALAATDFARLGPASFRGRRSVSFGSDAGGGADLGGGAAPGRACGLVVPGGACSRALGSAASSSWAAREGRPASSTREAGHCSPR